ncbi:MAG: hypothetical protein L0Y72_21435 [Gemmataceae bacterium]|nr:hypothetical protein [Gemmataceae bacterium]MCI0741607.1 hypothetical protein [Gemmataceae bacterium]
MPKTKHVPAVVARLGVLSLPADVEHVGDRRRQLVRVTFGPSAGRQYAVVGRHDAILQALQDLRGSKTAIEVADLLYVQGFTVERV